MDRSKGDKHSESKLKLSKTRIELQTEGRLNVWIAWYVLPHHLNGLDEWPGIERLNDIVFDRIGEAGKDGQLL